MSKKNIYIIDDDPIYQFSFKSMLKLMDAEFEISQYSNGEDAIEALAECDANGLCFPDIIFLDLNMPVMDGWNFLDELAAKFKDVRERTKLFIVSSSIHHEDIERSEKYNMVQQYLVKPIPRTALQDLI